MMREICAIRSDTYYCLSLCFEYPTGTLVKPSTANTIIATVNSLKEILGLGRLAGGADLFNAAVERNGDASGLPLLHLQIEYNRLFAGPSKPQAYPYEEAFLSQSGWAANSGRSLAREYLEGGLKLAPGFKDSPDHISLEFEFMAHLCEKEMMDAHDPSVVFDYRQQQRSFLENHIVNWVPAFLTTVERSAVVSFYKLLARIAREFVVWDYAHVEHLAQERERSNHVNA
jgi:TorA maturation chaperone TorD